MAMRSFIQSPDLHRFLIGFAFGAMALLALRPGVL
jgi:hypothetical protein